MKIFFSVKKSLFMYLFLIKCFSVWEEVCDNQTYSMNKLRKEMWKKIPELIQILLLKI